MIVAFIVFVKRSRASKETIKQLNILLPIKNFDPGHKCFNRRHISDNLLNMLPIAGQHIFICQCHQPNFDHETTGLLLRIENLKNFSSYVYTIHNAPSNVMPPPPPPQIGL